MILDNRFRPAGQYPRKQFDVARATIPEKAGLFLGALELNAAGDLVGYWHGMRVVGSLDKSTNGGAKKYRIYGHQIRRGR